MGRLSPRKANTDEKLCLLNRDNISTDDFWILVDYDSVTLAKQRSGEPSEVMLTIPKKDFNRLIDYYNREQICNSGGNK